MVTIAQPSTVYVMKKRLCFGWFLSAVVLKNIKQFMIKNEISGKTIIFPRAWSCSMRFIFVLISVRMEYLTGTGLLLRACIWSRYFSVIGNIFCKRNAACFPSYSPITIVRQFPYFSIFYHKLLDIFQHDCGEEPAPDISRALKKSDSLKKN